MSNSKFQIKEGDRLPALRATLTEIDGTTVIDLTLATAVAFRFQKDDGTGLTEAAATIVTAASGIVEYPWGVGDTDIPGEYNGEFIIDWTGSDQTVPSGCDEYIKFCIAPILA